MTDATIGSLTRLKRLTIDQAPITDAGLMRLRGLTNLEALDLDGCAGITDGGLEHLRGMTRLKAIGIPPNITDGGLATLKNLPLEEVLNEGQQMKVSFEAILQIRKRKALRPKAPEPASRDEKF